MRAKRQSIRGEVPAKRLIRMSEYTGENRRTARVHVSRITSKMVADGGVQTKNGFVPLSKIKPSFIPKGGAQPRNVPLPKTITTIRGEGTLYEGRRASD